MIRVNAFLILLSVATTASAQTWHADAVGSAEPINAVLGDESFEWAFGDARLARFADETLRIRTHLAHVEKLLRERDVADLPAALQHARAVNVDHLKRYREGDVFPRNYDFPERRPCFIDREGRICAVGYLVEQTAGRALAEAINARFQYELLSDMHDERLAAWATASGLTTVELAMIQPQYNPCGRRPCAVMARYGAACPPAPPTPAHAAGSGWILSRVGPVSDGQYIYATSFDLTDFDARSASISGQWAAAESGEIFLNGATTGVWGDVLLQGFAITTGFVAGVNTLGFRIEAYAPNHALGAFTVVGLAGTALRRGVPAPIGGLFDTGVDPQGNPLPSGSPDPHYLYMNPETLQANSGPYLGNAGFELRVKSAVPFAPTTLMLSSAAANLPLGGGCTLLIDPASIVAALPGQCDSNGLATFALPIPGFPSLFGFSLATQAVILDPAGPFVGSSLTNGLWLMIGV